MFVNRCYENEAMNNMPQNDMGYSPESCCQQGAQPIVECPCERVCHTQTLVNVPHIIPVHTRIINHRIYRHTYQPMYTCSMEEEVCNVYDNGCNY